MYRTPGISVTNQYEPLVNPSVGSGLGVAFLVGFDTSNLNFYPTRNVSFRRETLGSGVPLDIGFTTRPTAVLKEITDANRIVSLYQGATTYVGGNGVDTDTTVYMETVTLTKEATGTDSASTDVADTATIAALYSLNLETGIITYYTPTTDYTAVLSAGTVTITWVANAPTAGTTYYAIVGRAADYPADVDYYYNVIKATGETNLAIAVVWLDDTAGALPDDSSVFYATTRIEVPSTLDLYTGNSEATTAFGPMIDATDVTKVNYPSLAAFLASGENASSFKMVAYDTQTASTIDSAIEKLAADGEIRIVATTAADDPTGTATVNGKLVQHIESVSAEPSKKYRVGIIHPYSTTYDTDVAGKTFAGSLGLYDEVTQYISSKRIWIVSPPKVQINLPIPPLGNARLYTFSGGILSILYGAAYARAGMDAATSMLRKRINSIVNLLPVWDDVKLDKIASKAVTIFSKVSGRWTVRDDITSSRANQLMLSEPTITLIADDIALAANEVLQDGLVGGKLASPGVTNTIRDILGGMLSKKVQDGIIEKFGTPVLSINAQDPRAVNVSIPVKPMFTLKYIDVVFSYTSKL